jgi:cell wall-associated NlpC family hydrolase
VPRRPLTTALLVSIAASATAQQSNLSIGPFLTYLPTAGASPLAGLALTLVGEPIGFRASGQLSLGNQSTFASTNRPWGADADAMLFLGGSTYGYRRSLAPYVFAGVSTQASDSSSRTMLHDGWSYGAGLYVPLGGALDAFGETRYRMSEYVLPTAQGAATPRNELRFGLSFHVGDGGSSARRSTSRGRDRDIAVIPAGTMRIPAGGRASGSASAARVLPTAERYIGVKYRYGGTSPSSGFDCSGFVQYVFREHGVELPRTSREQATVGLRLSPDWRAVSAGDLVMFSEGGPISHVAIYAGRNRIIHSSSSGGGVRYDDLSTERGAWFVDHMVAARRVTPDASGLMLDLARGFADFAGAELDPPDHAPKPALIRR